MVYIAIVRDPHLRWQLNLRAERRAGKRLLTHNDSRSVSYDKRSAIPGCIDASSPPPIDAVLAPFLGEYTYAAYYYKHIDMVCLAVLAALQASCNNPRNGPHARDVQVDGPLNHATYFYAGCNASSH